jgi:hypothetical protein
MKPKTKKRPTKRAAQLINAAHKLIEHAITVDDVTTIGRLDFEKFCAELGRFKRSQVRR